MKKVMFLLVVMFLIFAGCSKNDSALIGKWGSEMFGIEMLNFKSDGSAIVVGVPYEWKTESGELFMESKGKMRITQHFIYKVKENKLLMNPKKYDKIAKEKDKDFWFIVADKIE